MQTVYLVMDDTTKWPCALFGTREKAYAFITAIKNDENGEFRRDDNYALYTMEVQ